MSARQQHPFAVKHGLHPTLRSVKGIYVAKVYVAANLFKGNDFVSTDSSNMNGLLYQHLSSSSSSARLKKGGTGID